MITKEFKYCIKTLELNSYKNIIMKKEALVGVINLLTKLRGYEKQTNIDARYIP